MSTRVTLPRGGLMSLRVRRGMLARCCRGRVWLTESDDIADYILRPNDGWQPQHGGGHVVLEAMEEAELLLRVR